MEEAGNDQQKQDKKRKRNPSEWKREKRKRLRVAGKSYINSRGDIVNERKIGEDCKCRRKCYKLVPEDERNKLFDCYYSLNSHDEQNAYLFGLIRKYDIARKRCKESDRRTCSYKYYVRVNDKEVQICRLAFAHIHGISPHKIRILCRKQDQNIMFPKDERGKHNNRPRKIPADTLYQIKDHIYSIIGSDRVREFLKDEKQNGPDLNITKMWKDYLEKYDPGYKEMLFGRDEVHTSNETNVLGIENELFTNFSESGCSELSDSHQDQTLAESIDSQYPISSTTETCRQVDSSAGSHYQNQNESEESSRTISKDKNQPIPVVKHWLYSKVFHEEFKVNALVTLKKKLLHIKDMNKSVGIQGNKSERKQRTPKKISREKDIMATNTTEYITALNPDLSVIDTASLELQNINLSQSADMYIFPINLQDLPQLTQSADIVSQPQHTMQFNLHTLPTQSNVITPVVNVPGPGATEGIQCSSVVSLPAGSVNLTQNSCSYMNLNMTTFY